MKAGTTEEDWQAEQETLYLLSVPGMRESILEGMKTPIEECDEGLDCNVEACLHEASTEGFSCGGRPETKRTGGLPDLLQRVIGS